MRESQTPLGHPASPDALGPGEIAKKLQSNFVNKAGLPAASVVILGMLGGAYIGFGGALATLVLTNSALGFGMGRIAAGFAFSLGLIMLVVGGGELFTGNNLMVVACARRRISWLAVLRNWTLSYSANATGALVLALAIHFSGVLESDALKATAIHIAEAKTRLDVPSAFVRAILCNVLVCLAVWLSTGARSVEGKVIAIMFPIGAFVALGFEHCIANFYLIPVGMLSGATIGLNAFFLNISVVTAGNAVGGLIVASAYYFIYLRTDGNADLGFAPLGRTAITPDAAGDGPRKTASVTRLVLRRPVNEAASRPRRVAAPALPAWIAAVAGLLVVVGLAVASNAFGNRTPASSMAVDPEAKPVAESAQTVTFRRAMDVDAYLRSVRQHAEKFKARPLSAETGTAVIRFTINRDGRASNRQVADSSGSPRLDGAALKTIRQASPFPRLSGVVSENSMVIAIPITF